MQYVVYRFALQAEGSAGEGLAHEDLSDILSDSLVTLGFDSFEYERGGLKAYIPLELTDEASLEAMLANFPLEGVTFDYEKEILPEVNWNEEWEKNYFQPISLNDGACVIRAPFHTPAKEAEMELIISPKMAFGTGNHETTSLVIAYLMEQDLRGKSVLDMGCGTGILGILALKRGASHLSAIDIDEWAYQNVQENASLNGVHIDEVICSDARALEAKTGEYDLILANITRNILLEDMPAYARCLRPGGRLILSGFYLEDIDLLSQRAETLGLHLCSKRERNRWAMLELGS